MPGGGRLSARLSKLGFAPGDPLGRGSGVRRPVLLGPFMCLFGVAHPLQERVAGRGVLRHLTVVLCLTPDELGGSRRHLGRMPPLRFLQRSLGVGQVLRERVAAGALLVDRRPKDRLAFAKKLCRSGETPLGFAGAGERVAHLSLQALPVGGPCRRRSLQMLASFLPLLARGCILTLNPFTVGPCRHELDLERLMIRAIGLRGTLRLRLCVRLAEARAADDRSHRRRRTESRDLLLPGRAEPFALSWCIDRCRQGPPSRTRRCNSRRSDEHS